MPIDVHAHYVPPQLIAAIKSHGKDIGVRLTPAEGGKEALGFDYGFKVRPFFPRLVESVPERLQLDGRAEDRPSDRRHLAGHFRLRPAAQRLHRLASDAQRHAGGMGRGQHRPLFLDFVGAADRRRSRRGRARAHRQGGRGRRHHLLQHREREPRRIPARSVLAQGRGARPADPDPSGECRARPAHPEVRARPDRALHLRHHARHRLAC